MATVQLTVPAVSHRTIRIGTGADPWNVDRSQAVKGDQFNALRVEGNVAADVRSTEEFRGSSQRSTRSALQILFAQIQSSAESGANTASGRQQSSIFHVVVVLLIVQRVRGGTS